MLKKLVLLFIIFNATGTYTMDTLDHYTLNPFVSSQLYIVNLLYKCVPSWLSWDSTPLQKIHADIKEFKNKLEFDTWYSLLPEDKLFLWELGLVFTTQEINTNPEKFLKYCFYQEYHHFEPPFSIETLDNNVTLLNACKNTFINGYSALGASLLAKDISYKEKLSFAKQLIIRGFEPTENDKNIAHLKRCNQVKKKYPRAITLLLNNKKQNHLAPLIPDIKKNIIRCMILSEKIAY